MTGTRLPAPSPINMKPNSESTGLASRIASKKPVAVTNAPAVMSRSICAPFFGLLPHMTGRQNANLKSDVEDVSSIFDYYFGEKNPRISNTGNRGRKSSYYQSTRTNGASTSVRCETRGRRYDGAIMMARTQITLETEMQRRARQRSRGVSRRVFSPSGRTGSCSSSDSRQRRPYFRSRKLARLGCCKPKGFHDRRGFSIYAQETATAPITLAI
jgi:hypothetical protein